MLFRNLIFVFIATSSTGAFASWEYQGFSGANNQILMQGKADFLKTPYPKGWDDRKFTQEQTCLCTQETKGELQGATKAAFGASPFVVSHASRFLRKVDGEVTTEVIGFFLKKDEIGKAFESMRKNLGAMSSNYAFAKSDKAVYLFRRTETEPQRWFLHFVRGYDDTANQREDKIQQELLASTAICETVSLEESKLDISAGDKEFLKKLMSFSYGQLLNKNFENALSATSFIFYKQPDKSNSYVSALLVKYKNEDVAKSAASDLNTRWDNSKNHAIHQKGEDVLWIGASKSRLECFPKIVEKLKTKAF